MVVEVAVVWRRQWQCGDGVPFAREELKIPPAIEKIVPRIVALSPLFNLGTQHDGRSARTWMKRV